MPPILVTRLSNPRYTALQPMSHSAALTPGRRRTCRASGHVGWHGLCCARQDSLAGGAADAYFSRSMAWQPGPTVIMEAERGRRSAVARTLVARILEDHLAGGVLAAGHEIALPVGPTLVQSS